MNKPKMTYFEKEDILHLVISDEPERDSIELSPNITAELNGNAELIGIEILNASASIQDIILDANFAEEFWHSNGN
ncbi:DUF2283 domain-containing protein [Candidatus Poribacteria bacterium]|nr:DUF2283 domain-containing protein [Candidatus Poribacteria bacterium]